MMRLKKFPINRTTRTVFESELVTKINNINQIKNFSNDALSQVSEKTYKEYQERQNTIEKTNKTKISHYNYEPSHVDNNNYVWFAKIDFHFCDKKVPCTRINDKSREIITIYIPRYRPKYKIDKRKTVQVYTTENVNEKKVEDLVNTFAYFMTLKQSKIDEEYKIPKYDKIQQLIKAYSDRCTQNTMITRNV